MKKLLIILVLSVIALAGCSTTKAGTITSGGPKNGIISNDYKFENVELDKAPEKITKLYEDNKDSQKIIVVDDDAYTYFIVMAGEKNTGGYGIKVESIEDNEEGKLKVTVKLTEPAKGNMVTMVITYPVDIVRIKKTDLPVYAVDTNGNSITVEKK